MQVAAGQGTVALELLAQLTPDQLGTVYVPVGGGGLITGRSSCVQGQFIHSLDCISVSCFQDESDDRGLMPC